MIPKSGYRFSEKIMLQGNERADASTTTTIRAVDPISSMVPRHETPAGSVPDPTTSTLTSTTTTSTLPHPTGWAGFDEMVGYDLLVHGDTSASVAVMIEGDLVHASG